MSDTDYDLTEAIALHNELQDIIERECSTLSVSQGDTFRKLFGTVDHNNIFDCLMNWIDVAHILRDEDKVLEQDPETFTIIQDYLYSKSIDYPELQKFADNDNDLTTLALLRESVLVNLVAERISYYTALYNTKPADTLKGRAEQLLSAVTRPMTTDRNGNINWTDMHNAQQLEHKFGVSWGTYKKYSEYDKHCETRGRVKSKTQKIDGMEEGALGVKFLYRDPDTKHYDKRSK